MDTEFSSEVKQVATVFKQYRNSIDVYTEDKIEDKSFYVQLLKRLLDGTTVKIEDVYPLGCKQEVIKACKADTDDSRPKIYIVDGDIFLQYKDEEPINNLYRLDSYCMENYVICENSICNTAYELNGGRVSLNDIRNKINYSNVLEHSLPLIDLFFWYSIQSELFNTFELRHINSFFNFNTVSVDTCKVNERIDEIRTSLKKHNHSESELDELLLKRKLKLGNSTETLLKIVSGKDFLIPLFINVINKQVNKDIKLPRESWKYQLAKTCDIRGLEDLRNAILNAC